MEIQFAEEELYNRLGRRIFDVYVQGELFLKDFNIKERANGTLKPIVIEKKAVNVTDHMLEIRLYWAGKGTTLIPKRGYYGPLISAISVCHSSLEPQCGAEKTKHHSNYPLIFGLTGAMVTIILLALGIYARRRCRGDNNTRERELRAQGLQTVCFTWRQLQAATNDFDEANKLGEGGFGSVFKGELSDGTVIAVKQLSSTSSQGNREFVNEIGMISGLNHPNLVKLYGCCVEKNQLLLVYEYMENNSLALALFGKSSLKLDWAARQKICVGIARGLEFLHEGSTIRMVHRDIKTTNVLLDTDLNAKISDFGLARLHEKENTHISTRIAGTIDLTRNYLSGTIPMEWASLPYLTTISLSANLLSGNLPIGLKYFKNLKKFGVEGNQFSGPIPDELGNLTNLTVLFLSSNQFTGSIPSTLARLVNLEEFWVCDNNFTGIIPGYIGNWSRLQKLHLYTSGLRGPIPDAVARLEYLTELSISDTTGIHSFPSISSNAIKTLILRNVSLSGPIPSYIWNMRNLKTLDLSFNKLTGEVQGVKTPPKYTYLTGNMLSGAIESGVFLNSKSNIDLSYNNFSWLSSCQYKSNINTYRSSYLKNNLTGLLPCAGPINCKNYQRSLHINCGGENVNITNSLGKITYQADSSKTNAATNKHFETWGISNTGHFTDDKSDDDTYIISTSLRASADYPEYYKTARRSALSLVYYAFCLENGAYNVKLHFMEIQFAEEELYSRSGRRIFDIYVQGELFLKDFNIKEEVNGTLKPVVKEKKAVNVTDHMLEIRLYWVGKGTTIIPNRGYYGPLISAISLCHHSLEPQCGAEKTKLHTKYPLIFGVTGAFVTITLLALGLYAQKRCREDKNTRERELRAQGLQTACFTWRQLQAATNNFDQANKLGEGGFGSVFKGELSDGTIIAVKQLSSMSSQGNREFLNEIGMISGLNHPNLVRLYGWCVEKNQLLLVYEYMENNSLALVLSGKSSLKLDWAARQKICVGIARGLEFLHEGSMIRMVHRDIKTTNVLLDAEFNAKISDFGLARLHEEEHTHISTKVAGTIGYMAPEYVLWGQLTEKADVYSFGVVAMEIVSGKSNTKQKGNADHVSLIDWALTLQQKGDILEIVDPMLEGDFNSKEAVRMINIALVCTNSSPSLRPTMSEAVQMLEGVIEITPVMSDPGLYGPNWSSKLRDIDTHGSSITSGVTDQMTTTMKSSVSGYDLYPLYPESMILNSTTEFSSSSL